MHVYEHPFLFTPLHQAWAFWVCTVQGFSNKIGSSLTGKDACLCANKRIAFTRELGDRLIRTQIEQMDAVELIKYKCST
ncbi:MAG TPA: hypothetical protein VFQ86_02685 [Arachidicoccus soli]|nr:hypothetical protein [Arachidicoccus soli]